MPYFHRPGHIDCLRVLLYMSTRNVPDAITIDKMRSLIMELDAKGVLQSVEAWYALDDS